MNKAKRFGSLVYQGFVLLWTRHRFKVPVVVWKHYASRLKYKMKFLWKYPYSDPNDQSAFLQWINVNEKTDDSNSIFEYNPLISIIIPVYNTPKNVLIECILSALNHTYTNLELIIVNDNSDREETLEALKMFEFYDERIKIMTRTTNGNISIASNDAIFMASGEFIALLDHDDVLAQNALSEVVKVLNLTRDLDFIYSDEDKLDPSGKRCSPHFKPDYSPDALLSSNYICHLSVIRRTIVLALGGFRSEYNGAQDYDLFLRISRVTQKFYHIPKILYHWRMSESSTAMSSKNKVYAQNSGANAIKDHLDSLNIKANVKPYLETGYYLIEYLVNPEPKVSIIIPTKDQFELLNVSLESIFQLTTYSNFEVLVVNNRSAQKETFAVFETYRNSYPNFRTLNMDIDFNFSIINNEAVKQASGEFLLFLNNDTQIIDGQWLTMMVGQAQQEHTGAVGAMLLYQDKTIQHAGVVLGIGGIAAHAYQHAEGVNGELYGRLSVPYNYSAVTAACLMVSRIKFDEIKGFEEKLSVAFNDVDLCLKLRLKGYYNVLLPQVKLYHFESKSRGSDFDKNKYKRFLNETEYMNSHWKKWIDQDPFYNPNFTKSNWFLLDKDQSKM